MNLAWHAIAAALLMCGGVAAAFAQELWLRQADGKIVTVTEDNGAADPWHQLIERRNADGSPDRYFGTGGRVSFTLGNDSLGPRSVRVDSKGRLIVVGAVFGGADRSTTAVARFQPNGRADLAWGVRGTSLVASAEGNAQGLDALAMSDDSMLVLGQVESGGTGHVVLWRLRADGSVDPGFGQEAGVLRLPPLDGAQTMNLRLDEDGAALIASQRQQAGGRLLEVHRWQPGEQGVQLIARQLAPAVWRGTVALDRRGGRWQWTDADTDAAASLVAVEDKSAPSASLGQASFNPFAVPRPVASLEPVAEVDREVAPGLGWLWLFPALSLLGLAAWRWRGVRATDMGLIDSRTALLDVALKELQRTPPPAPAEEGPVQTDSTAQSATASPSARNGLERALCGPPDDLKRIKGIGPVLEKRLQGEGIFYFWQIAQWRPEDVAQIGARLSGFRGRIERDHWVEQAIELTR